MKYSRTTEKLINLLFRFIDNKLRARVFVRRFLDLWARDRDEQWRTIEDRNGSAAEQLQRAFLNKQMDRKAFTKEWDKLRGKHSQQERRFLQMVDGIHSACDAFSDDPRSDWELSEDQLRSFVVKAIESYLLAVSKSGRSSHPGG
jgi:hypothetical protein